jgi:hypothetical protein
MLAASPTWTDEAVLGVLAAQLFLLVVAAIIGWFQLREQFRPFVVVDRDAFTSSLVGSFGGAGACTVVVFAMPTSSPIGLSDSRPLLPLSASAQLAKE